jgi:hypothetical protein
LSGTPINTPPTDLSTSGDQGADPNLLVKVTDRLDRTTLPNGEGLGHFKVIRAAKSGEVLRGVAFAPQDGGGDNEDGNRADH